MGKKCKFICFDVVFVVKYIEHAYHAEVRGVPGK